MGRGPVATQIVRSGYNALPEQALPDTIDPDSGQQGGCPGIGLRQTPSQRQSPAAAPAGRTVLRVQGLTTGIGEHCRHPGLHLRSRSQVVPPDQKIGRRRRSGIHRCLQGAIGPTESFQGGNPALETRGPRQLLGVQERLDLFFRRHHHRLELLLEVALRGPQLVFEGLQRDPQVLSNHLGNLGQPFVHQALFVGMIERIEPAAERLDPKVQPAVGPIDRLLLQRGGLGQRPIIGLQPLLGVVGRREDGRQPVVVQLGNGVVLVVVALGAAHGESHHVAGEGLNGALQDPVTYVGRIEHVLVGVVGGDSQKAGGLQQAAHGGAELRCRAPVDQLVSGQLLGDETVVGLVPVDGIDDVVAILPLSGNAQRLLAGHEVVIAAQGVGIAGLIQPMASPALPEMRGSQQPFHQLLIGQRGTIGQEGVHLSRRRGQSDQVQIEAPHQEEAAGIGRKPDPLFLQLLQQKGIHRGAHPLGLVNPRRVRGRQLAKGPVFPVGPGKGRCLDLYLAAPVGRLVRSLVELEGGRSGSDPAPNDFDVLTRGFLLSGRGHGPVRQALVDQAGVGGMLHQPGSAGPALLDQQRVGQIQPAHGLQGPVAVGTVTREDRQDFRFELRDGLSRSRPGNQQQSDRQPQP